MSRGAVGEGSGGAPRARLFVALELPGEVRAELARWANVLDTGVWRVLDVADLHVTLCFLGAREAGEIPAIARACAEIADAPAASLQLGEVLWLPRRSPRVLALALDDAGGRLAAVQRRLSERLHAGGWYVPERRAFLAHVTVARVRRGARVRAEDVTPPAGLGFAGDRVTLFRSHLGRGGARYEALATVALGG